jgi:mycobactin lysine-N-oxygenase
LTAEPLQETIGHDLAVNGITPKLFLPGLSGLTQGSGFPNLFCPGCCPTGFSAPTSPPAGARPSDHQARPPPDRSGEAMSTNPFDDDNGTFS